MAKLVQGLAVATVATAVICFLYRLVTKRRKSTVPGLKPTSDRNGNLDDIGRAGGLHPFLYGLHRKFGPLASFWWGNEYVISVSSPELFKQHKHLFDRPGVFFRSFEPILSPDSIQFTNGAEGRARRRKYDIVFRHGALDIYYDKLQKVADEMVAKWSSADPDKHLPLREHTFLYAVKAVLLTLFGDKFKDDKEALAFKVNNDVAWHEIELRLTNPVLPDDSSERIQSFNRALDKMKELVRRAIKDRKDQGGQGKDFLLIDAIMAHHQDDDKRFADAVTFTVGGLHTTGTWVAWCLFFMALHQDVQEKVYREILSVLGPSEPVTHQSIGKLTYLRQVMDESLRCSMLGSMSARCTDTDEEIAGHSVPAGTSMLYAHSVVSMDENIWPDPTKFDPDRFSAQVSKGRPAMAFSPFGFAGRRQCPANRFVYVKATVLLVSALQRFTFHLVPSQEPVIEYGIIAHPKDEIWVKVTKRS